MLCAKLRECIIKFKIFNKALKVRIKGIYTLATSTQIINRSIRFKDVPPDTLSKPK